MSYVDVRMHRSYRRTVVTVWLTLCRPCSPDAILLSLSDLLQTILEYYNIPLPREVVERGKEDDLCGLESLITPVHPVGSPPPPPSSAAPSSLSEAIGRSLNLVQSLPTELAQPRVDGEKKEEDPVIKFVEELTVPAEVPLDLKTKIAVCLIHLYSTAPQVREGGEGGEGEGEPLGKG